METIEYLKEIPFLLKAKRSKQWSATFASNYLADKENKTNAFARNTDRFGMLKDMRTPFYMHFKKKYILDQLTIMNYSHKENNLTDMQKIDLAKTYKRVEKKDAHYSDVPMTASEAKRKSW